MASNEKIIEIKKKLEEHEKRIQELEKVFRISKAGKQKVYVRDSKEGIERLAKKTAIAKERIQEIYDLEEDSLTLVKIVGKGDREKTINATLLILSGYKYIFGKDEISSQEIRRNVAENRIPLNNFSTYLNKIIPSLIRRKGKLRSPETIYRLTLLGEAEAKELLKKLCR